MKRFNFVLVILISFALIALLRLVREGNSNNATKSDLESVKIELKNRIDSILKNQDSIKAELDTIKLNTDTLKAGQVIIFKTMKENKEKSFWDYFK